MFWDKLRQFIKLIRIHQAPKNFFIFIPLLFSKKFLVFQLGINTMMGFFAFFLLSGCVYIINDINDIEEDSLHPKKRLRPLASGKLSIKEAHIGLAFLLVLLAFVLAGIYLIHPVVILVMAGYLLNNILYSKLLKKIPFLDLLSVSTGFILRIYAGALIIDEQISTFLLLAMISITLLIISVKRYRELVIYGENARKVLKYYSARFLKNFITLLFICFIIIYFLFTLIDRKSNPYLIISNLPILALAYNYARQTFNTEHKEDDPFKLFLKSRFNLIISTIWFLIVLYSLIEF